MFRGLVLYTVVVIILYLVVPGLLLSYSVITQLHHTNNNPSFNRYCDTDDGAQFGDPDRVRRYRLVLQKLQNAVVHFESADVSFCVLLGDVIDGKCKKLGQTSADYETLINLITDNSTKEWYFNVGNHDFYNFSRQEIYESHFYIPASSKAVCNANKLYYDTCPAPGFRFVWLDPFEISTFSAVNDDSTKLANETLFKMNPNIRDGNINWLENLSEDVRQYVPYNGACGDEQMLWFKEVLSKSEATKEKVFVFCHTPIHRKCCRLSARAWNSDELLKVIQDSCAVQVSLEI